MRSRRIAVVLVLALALVTPSAWAAEHPSAPGFLQRVWSWLTSVWSTAGCILDPLGCPAPPSTDEGCIIDPLGCPEG